MFVIKDYSAIQKAREAVCQLWLLWKPVIQVSYVVMYLGYLEYQGMEHDQSEKSTRQEVRLPTLEKLRMGLDWLNYTEKYL